MKYLTLLLALVLPLTGQTLTNTNLDGVTNATINGKLDDDAAATRTALGLGTAATAASADFADDGAVFYAARYGVLADGVTNDTVALQAAIDAAAVVASASARSVVVLPSGLIRLSRSPLWVSGETNKQAISLKSNVNIVGQGIGATTLKLLDSVASDCPVLLAPTGNAANIAISNLTIDGNAVTRLGPVAGGEDEGMNFKGGTNVIIHQVRITNCGQDAIDLDAGSDVTISGCVADSNYGNGLHNFGGGPVRTKVIGCHFLSNGFLRRASDGVSGSGSGIDNIGTIQISDCTFVDNSVEIQTSSGIMQVDSCSFSHGGGGANLSPILVGNPSTAPGETTHFQISDSYVFTSVASGLEIVNNFTSCHVQNTRIRAGVGSGVLATSAGKLVMTGNNVSAIYGAHLIATSGPALIASNRFDSYANGLRIEASANGGCFSNLFGGTGGSSDIQLRAGSTGWSIIGNQFTGSTEGIQSVAGGGGSVKIFGNTGGIKLSLGATNGVFKNNELGTIALNSVTTGNVFEDNTISGTITHTVATFASNTWRRNTGAGCAGIFYGTATLTSGTATVNTAAANSARKWSLSRQSTNSSTSIGNLALGTVTAQTSFVINALNDSAATATGDLSTVYWEILE